MLHQLLRTHPTDCRFAIDAADGDSLGQKSPDATVVVVLFEQHQHRRYGVPAAPQVAQRDGRLDRHVGQNRNDRGVARQTVGFFWAKNW